MFKLYYALNDQWSHPINDTWGIITYLNNSIVYLSTIHRSLTYGIVLYKHNKLEYSYIACLPRDAYAKLERRL